MSNETLDSDILIGAILHAPQSELDKLTKSELSIAAETIRNAAAKASAAYFSANAAYNADPTPEKAKALDEASVAFFKASDAWECIAWHLQ